MFQQTTRQLHWEVHLLEEFAKYFFAFYQINNARLAPVCISEMQALKENEPNTWHFLKEGNFSDHKSGIPFAAIGADHGLKQQNKTMKVIGGIQGIANKTLPWTDIFL